MIFSGNVGLIISSSFLTADATFNTFDFVCLTTPKPIAFSPLALRNPLSFSAPILISDISPSFIFLSFIFFMTISLNILTSDNLDLTWIPISLSIESSRPAGFSIFSLLIAVKISSTVIFLADISSGLSHIRIAYFLSPPTVIDATPGKIDSLSTIFLSR